MTCEASVWHGGHRLMRELGKEAVTDVRLYFTGGATAVLDVRQMLDRGLIDPFELRQRFEEIEPLLYRYPAIDPADFRRALEETLGGEDSSE